jgi:putative acetyltransferase
VDDETRPTIRRERHEAGERSSVHLVNEVAFGQPDEADLVDRLRTEGAVLLSLIAELNNRIVAHILFSRMWIETACGSILAVALAPIAVLPTYQRQGIGGRLIRKGLDLLRREGEHIVIVVGHSEYYPQFGFSTQKARSLESPFAPEVFMAIELTPGALDRVQGKVRYPGAFGL